MREGMIEAFVDVLEGHTVGQALENQRHGQARGTNGRSPSQQLRIGHNSPVVLVGLGLKVHHWRQLLASSYQRQSCLPTPPRLAGCGDERLGAPSATPRAWRGLLSTQTAPP